MTTNFPGRPRSTADDRHRRAASRYGWGSVLTLLLLLGPVGELAAQFPREQVEPLIAPVLADVPVTGLLVFDVIEGSQAAAAGFQVGDILTHYDGQPVATHEALRHFAAAAALEKRSGLLVLFHRGGKEGDELEATFDPAPLGLRMIPVREGEQRLLGLPATPYEPTFASLEAQVDAVQWWLLYRDGAPVGWRRSLLIADPSGQQLALRTQSYLPRGEAWHRHDQVVGFRRDRFLTPQSLWLTIENKPILDFQRTEDRWVGKRVGVPVRAYLAADAVADSLVGLVASTLPYRPGVSLPCSYLGPASHSPAPFASLASVESPGGAGSEPQRFEVRVFGQLEGTYWLSEDGQVVGIHHADGLEERLADRRTVESAFPQTADAFGPIEQFPSRPAEPAGALKAN